MVHAYTDGLCGANASQFFCLATLMRRRVRQKLRARRCKELEDLKK